MSETSATFLLLVLVGYCSVGLIFALAFVSLGLSRVDAAAANAGIGFRLMIVPGATLFWPLLASRWLRGGGQPPDERSAHIGASRWDPS